MHPVAIMSTGRHTQTQWQAKYTSTDKARDESIGGAGRVNRRLDLRKNAASVARARPTWHRSVASAHAAARGVDEGLQSK